MEPGTPGLTTKRAQDLKGHMTRAGHHECKTHKVTATAVTDAKTAKRIEMQQQLPKVKWGQREIKNAWRSKYLGSIFEAGGSQMTDVRTRIAMASQRFGKIHHLWRDHDLHLNLRLRLYRASVCSILTYGSEAWVLTQQVRKALNGANARMLSIITGNTIKEEASPKTQTFDLVKWVRARRLQWLGHILRMGTERMIKQAIYEIFMARQDGDMLMDAPKTDSWRELCTFACDRDYWSTRVRAMKQPRVAITMGPHIEPGKTISFTVNS